MESHDHLDSPSAILNPMDLNPNLEDEPARVCPRCLFDPCICPDEVDLKKDQPVKDMPQGENVEYGENKPKTLSIPDPPTERERRVRGSSLRST